MKITLLITTFNSLSQLTYTYLKDKNYKVDIVYAINNPQMIKEVEKFEPDIIFCPYLKKFIPKEIFEKYPTFILHPGIIGDRGAYSLDNVVRQGLKRWGVTILKASSEYDSGDVYVTREFDVISKTKAGIYRNEVKEATLEAIEEFLKVIKIEDFTPLKPTNKPFHKYLTKNDRTIDWQNNSTSEIIKKINMSDSFPGVEDNILGVSCYLFGAWKENKLKGKPKEILAKRDGAICLGTIDGALWISHLKELNRFKLPATYVLKQMLKGVKEHRLPLIFDKSYNTFYEISCDIKDSIAYLYFNFHNGAFRAEQCIRLKYAIEYLKNEVDAIVLMGGEQFFSNGINLNILEDSKKSGEDGWSTINAINDLIKTVLFNTDSLMIASLHKNAGAGGVFLASACDFVVAKKSCVLNPHYKTIGLSGSEYHTFTLPKRVGNENAKKLINECLPISANKAKELSLVDEVYDENYFEHLHNFVLEKLEDDNFLLEKEEFLEENEELIEDLKEKEIKKIHPQFWDENSSFHILRYKFVYKICPTKTPKRLKHA